MLEELSLQRLGHIAAPRYMRVDEGGWLKWHKYVTNVVDIEERKVIWNHNGRGKTSRDAFYLKLGRKGYNGMEAVASDGARGFLSSARGASEECGDCAGSFPLSKRSLLHNLRK